MTTFKKDFGKMHKYWSLGIFYEVLVSKFEPGLDLEGYCRDYITDHHIFVFWNLCY